MAFNTAYGLDSDPEDHWSKYGACKSKQVDPEIFFNEGKGPAATARNELARKVCQRCPVLEDCTKWVAEHPQEFGVWAALTPDERRTATRPTARLCTSCGNGFLVTVASSLRLDCDTCERAAKAKAKPRLAPVTPGLYKCVNGHPYDEENTRRNSRGRKCKACNTILQAERRAAQRLVSA